MRSGAEDRRNGVQSIRVDLDKIDRVVNMVGELVITQSMLTQQMDETLRARYQELVRGLEVLAQTTRGLQDSVMSIRAQPVKTVFSRMPRLVRELASKTGKKIRLETIGENTEIDKTIIEQLSDPLTHMIRNSADHGIESRVQADPAHAVAPHLVTMRGFRLEVHRDDVELARTALGLDEPRDFEAERLDREFFYVPFAQRPRWIRWLAVTGIVGVIGPAAICAVLLVIVVLTRLAPG